jgi:hypothetical protein
MQGCATKPKPNVEIVIPPQPQRKEMPQVQTMTDVAKVLNYYEHLVQEWEAWGATVEKITSENP